MFPGIGLELRCRVFADAPIPVALALRRIRNRKSRSVELPAKCRTSTSHIIKRLPFFGVGLECQLEPLPKGAPCIWIA